MPDSPIRRILIVRLGALGDIVHALPVASALRDGFPSVRIDWLVSERHRAILQFVPVVDRLVVLKTAGWGVARLIDEVRRNDYDIAFDLQGLLKSAVLARCSGARRVVGFAADHLRERWASVFYKETVAPPAGVHVVGKNLALLAAVGLLDVPWRFPLAASPLASPKLAEGLAIRKASEGGFALLNPGAAWPNKQWAPERFGAIAARLRTRHALPSIVLWGPGEEPLAQAVVDASEGAAALAPPTGIGELIALARAAALFVSGDTGPLHIAAACGTPIVGIYGPTSPARNGPWDDADVCLSRFDACRCHHRRRCRLPVCCLADITVDEVMAAIDQRLGGAGARAERGSGLQAPGSSREPETGRREPSKADA